MWGVAEYDAPYPLQRGLAMNPTLIALACNLYLPIVAPPAVLAPGVWEDCNYNGIPDDQEPYHDCNANEVQDICDVAEGNSADCNRSGVLDECEFLRFCETAAPGLDGYYGGHKGLPRGGEGRYDFGRRFLLVRAAWLDFEIVLS